MPCEADYRFQSLGLITITVQFLIYNEFEQRFSTSTKIRCFEKTFLSDIDTRPGPDGDAFSISSVGTQGTLKGHFAYPVGCRATQRPPTTADRLSAS